MAEETDEAKRFRLNQTIVVLKKLRDDLGLPYDSTEIQAIKARMSDFVATGEPWEGEMSLIPWKRVAHLKLKRGGAVELTLRAMGKRKQVQ